jgi:IS605 OrfB family transposase
MKLTIRLKLLPSPEQKTVLLDTMDRFNAAASFAAQVAFDAKVFSQHAIHKLTYRAIRQRFGLSAQMAVRAIGKAVEAFQRDQKICPVFRPEGAVIYDPRILSFKGLNQVSLWTPQGRLRIALVFGAYERDRFDRIQGQVDLVYRDGQFFLLAGIDVPACTPSEPQDFLGVDLGIVNLATDSAGQRYSGADVETVRKKHKLQRQRLQRKGTKGAKKKLKRLRRKEARFRRHQNHVISKQIVQTAQRTASGIALEDLTGIRKRVTARGGDARNRLGGWAFAQLGAFIVYKAQLAGVVVEFVDPAYSSQTCSECGHCARANRTSQAEFHCQACGHRAHADVNAARNHRAQAEEQWRRRHCGKPALELGGRRAG